MKDFKAAFIGFGEVNTPREMIEKKCSAAKEALLQSGVILIDGGVVSDDPGRTQAAAALSRLEGTEPDALILCIAGWIPSYAVIRIADHFKHLPVILWGLCGSYTDGRLVTTAEQAGTSALRKPMTDLGFSLTYCYDTTDGGSALPRVLAALKVAKAKKSLSTAKVCMLGYRDMNLYGTMFDGVSLKRRTGVEIEFVEMLDMVRRSEQAHEEEVLLLLSKLKKDWKFTKPASDEILKTGIRYYLALRDIVSEKGYEAISLIDVDGMKRLLGFPPSMVLMLLANELGLCTTPENDALGNVTQLIVKALTGQIGAYMEFYEYMTDRVLMGVPDYIPMEVADGDYTVMPTSFGLLDSCILNVSKVKTGTVTLSRLFSCPDGSYGMHLALADAVSPRAWEEAGWTPPAPQLPSLELVMGDRTENFVQNVMCQHYIISYGDNRPALREYCRLAGIRVLEA